MRRVDMDNFKSCVERFTMNCMKKKESFESLEQFCECMEIPKQDVITVVMPDWWTKVDYPVLGFTDDQETYCCCLNPSIYVWVPEFDYDGYFAKKDLREVPV
jgi:hypothetical protein